MPSIKAQYGILTGFTGLDIIKFYPENHKKNDNIFFRVQLRFRKRVFFRFYKNSYGYLFSCYVLLNLGFFLYNFLSA